ncbi:hypothetical protein A7D27_05065 [Pseudomonas sp. 1D4]|uniref:hypothetical protein n=1 Tax=Pseudomonadaceae TaxID=135621 RepID=UPI00084ACC3A|nr:MULTISPECIES: hypothetical protein [Pseudomonas]OEC45662.1 hypothetical protein A7D27_05065 [Pseudomonas sp. 1D4]
MNLTIHVAALTAPVSRALPEYIEDLARVDRRALTLLQLEQAPSIAQIAALTDQRPLPQVSLV